MDPILNPYSPGAGTPPPELAGRDELLLKNSIALQRISKARSAKSVILTGLRGAGKTVLLNKMRLDAEKLGFITVRFEVTEGRSMASLLVSNLKTALLKLDKGKAAGEYIKKGFVVLTSFARAMKLKYHDVEVSIDAESDLLLTENSDLEDSLVYLLQAVGAAAQAKKTAVILFIDELQLLTEKELAALIMALHITAQDQLPITLVAAGLPQLPAKMGKAKTYAERLFEFIEIGQLDETSAKQALTVPAKELNTEFTQSALREIIQQTQGYAYFIQEWGKHAWDCASKSPIELKDVKQATLLALADLDSSFFRVRFEQLTESQKKYLSAMAQLGPGEHTSGNIAEQLGKKVTDLGDVRAQLISKGLIYSPAHGQTAFTVPLFDEFMLRVMGK